MKKFAIVAALVASVAGSNGFAAAPSASTTLTATINPAANTVSFSANSGTVNIPQQNGIIIGGDAATTLDSVVTRF